MGELTFRKCQYVGEFNNGKMEGNGELRWKNGRKLVGVFENGKAEGIMDQVSKEGVVKKTYYKRGKFVKFM